MLLQLGLSLGMLLLLHLAAIERSKKLLTYPIGGLVGISKRKTTTCTLFMYISPFLFTSLNSLQFHFRLRWILLLTYLTPHRVLRAHTNTHTHTQSQSLFKCCSGPCRQTITNNITNNIYRNKPTTSFCHLHILLRADCCVHVRANSLRLRMKQEMCARCETTLEIESILCCSVPLNLSLFSFLCICTAGQEKCSCW